MAKAKKLTVFERGRIVELHKQGLSQRAIAAEVGRSKTAILHFLKDPQGYGTKNQVVAQKISAALSGGSEWLSVKTRDDPRPKLRPLLVLTGSPITIRRHLRGRASKTRNVFKGHVSFNRHKIARLDFAREHQTWDIQSGGGAIMIWGVFSFNGTMELQVVQGSQTAAGYVEMLHEHPS
ncbi:unnamed protein product [Pleuronectes platessa]|uniref:Transposase IS30-like HTH domain-containing protein n=1 Tax=Pleuronectes platessa TaxID=8262 RepID=A0A9N7YNP4_PLEPL|nr:unnamed protein product [Pleuronectes platessa]